MINFERKIWRIKNWKKNNKWQCIIVKESQVRPADGTHRYPPFSNPPASVCVCVRKEVTSCGSWFRAWTWAPTRETFWRRLFSRFLFPLRAFLDRRGSERTDAWNIKRNMAKNLNERLSASSSLNTPIITAVCTWGWAGVIWYTELCVCVC